MCLQDKKRVKSLEKRIPSELLRGVTAFPRKTKNKYNRPTKRPTRLIFCIVTLD